MFNTLIFKSSISDSIQNASFFIIKVVLILMGLFVASDPHSCPRGAQVLSKEFSHSATPETGCVEGWWE